MNKKIRIISLLLSILVFAAVIPISVLTASAAGGADAMTEIENEHSSKRIGDTQNYSSDGYIGIPIGISVYYDTSKGAAEPSYEPESTPVIVYVVNTMATRTGTDTDADIISDMLDKGYVVLVLDYKNNVKAISPDLDWSVQGLLANIRDGKYFPADNEYLPDGKYYNTIVVPSGHNVTFNKVFFEMDKHAADGTLERIVHAWNNDFRGVFANEVIKWVHSDGTKKAVQNGFDGSEPVWYSDASGTVENENGQYIKIKHTLAQTITDCVKADGTPIDLNLYMHIVYPTNPENAVPVMSLSSSSEHLASGLRTADRPHVNGFLFDGYAIAAFDHAYVPMSRNDHYGYFDGNSMPGSVTGDNISYTVELYNMQKISTAAMRYIRYLSLSENEKYKFDIDAIGVVGNSKGSIINFLGAPELQADANEKVGNSGIADSSALDSYVDTKINSLVSQFDLPEHHGESRYQNGDTETVAVDGFVVDGGTLQPWLSYNGEEIASGANFVYANCGGNPTLVGEGYSPIFVSLHMGSGEQSGYNNQNVIVNVARQHDVPALYFESDLGHTLIGREELNYNVDPYAIYKDYVNFCLNNSAVKVAYTTPADKHMDVSTTGEITIKFTGMVSESEIQKITLSNGTHTASGIWTSEFGGTEWTFAPDALEADSLYTLTVPAGFAGTNGVAAEVATETVFTTDKESVFDCSISGGMQTVTDSAGTILSFTAPDMAEYVQTGANKFALRIKVDNDAANIANVYALASAQDVSGTLIGSVNLRGSGYYEVDISSYMEGVSAGDTVYLLVKADKAASVAQTFSESFDSKNNFAVSSRVTQTLASAPDGTSALMLTTEIKNGTNGFDYYTNDAQALWNNKLIKDGALTDSDLGRRFTIKVRVYDTISRQLTMFISGRTNVSQQIRDYQISRYNFTTVANEWQEFTIEYTVYDMDYGSIGYGTKSFQAYISSDGNNQSPIYIDYVNVSETVTDIELSECALVLSSEGDFSYKAPESLSVYFDVNGAKYGSFAAAINAASNGSTVKLLRNYAFADSDISDVSSIGNIVIDLNGYKLTAKNTQKAPIYIKSADTNALSITVKNGSLLVGRTALISYEGSVSSGSGKTVNISFENVYIGYDEYAKTDNIITENTSADGVKINSNITFTDCRIDIDQYKHTENKAVLFTQSSEDVTLKYRMTGGSIKASSFTKTTINGEFNALTLAKDNGGSYPTLILPNSVVLSDNLYITEDNAGSYVLPAEGYDPDGYTEYNIEVSTTATKYGAIPEEYSDTQSYPFAVFSNGEFLGAYAYWGDTGATSAVDSALERVIKVIENTASGAGSEVTVLLRRDYTTTSANANYDRYWNIGACVGTLTVDLGGNTMTAAKAEPFFLLQAKRAAGVCELNINLKNGTVAVKSNEIFRLSTYSGFDSQRTVNITMANVTVSRVTGASSSSSGLIVKVDTAGTINLNTNITLNNCTVDLKTNPASGAVTLFGMTGSDKYVTNITVNGGKIEADSFDGITLHAVDDEAYGSLKFGKYEGSYTELHIANGSAPADEFMTSDGDSVTFAESETAGVYKLVTAEELPQPEVTPYGTIPVEYDKETYPFAIFKNGEFIGAYSYYCDNNLADIKSALENIYSVLPSSNEVTLLLRRDYVTSSVSNYDIYYNLGKLSGTFNFDLGGNSITTNNGTALLFLEAKTLVKSGEFNINLKNGTVLVKKSPLIQIQSSASYTGMNTVNIDISDVTVRLAESASTSLKGLIAYVNGTNPAKVQTNITLNNCTVDLKTNAPSTALTIFAMAETNSYVTNVIVNGGKILVSDMSNITLYTITSTEEDSFIFGKYEGAYTELHIASGNAPSDEFITSDGESVSFAETETAGVYNLSAVIKDEVTVYGTIPAEYDKETYPFAVFKDGEFLGAYTYWGDTGATSGVIDSAWEMAYNKILSSPGGEATILLRRDYTTTSENAHYDRYWNIGILVGTITFDLAENTLTAAKGEPLFLIQGKRANGECNLNINVKNGTILAKSKEIFRLSTYSGFDGNKTVNITMTDITVGRATGASASSSGLIVRVDTESTINLKTNITLNNCTIDMGTNAPGGNVTLFGLTGSDKYLTNVTVNGGKIIASSLDNINFYAFDDPSYGTFKFGKYEGVYTKLYLETQGAPTDTFTTDEGEFSFVKIGTDAEYFVYTLTAKSVSSFVPKVSVSLYSDLRFNVYIPLRDDIVSIIFCGETVDISSLEVKYIDGNPYYLLKKNLMAHSAAEDIILKATLRLSDDKTATGTFTLGVLKYAQKVIDNEESTEIEKLLMKDMLSYISAAYAYANRANAATVAAAIIGIIGEGYTSSPDIESLNKTPSAPGIASASMDIGTIPVFMFYPETNDDGSLLYGIDKYVFKSQGRVLETEYGESLDGTAYIKVYTYAYGMCSEISYSIEGTDISGSYNIGAYYEAITTLDDFKDDADLINLVLRLWRYSESARDYRNEVMSK